MMHRSPMPPVPMPDPSVDFLKGTLDLMILKTLSWGPAHGYGIARWIEQCTDDTLAVTEGSLYPALHKLAERGYIVAEWGLTEHNRQAKIYRLTAAGKKRLRAAHDEWSRFAGALIKVLESAPRPS
jgi:PadR family transcriptional regulator, regulatory protein PadR